jgi:hypothetical protein
MSQIKPEGWGIFHKGFPWFKGENKYPLPAYSEFMPAIKAGLNPSTGDPHPWVFSEDDLYGWQIREIEEEYQLKPGMDRIGRQVMEHIIQLGKGKLPVHLAGHNRRNLTNNLFWPAELASFEGSLDHEQYVSFQPFSLSVTKDDKGRVNWTFFGASEQGPEKAFWNSFYESPGKEVPESKFISLMQWVFKHAYGKELKNGDHLKSLGFRILQSGDFYPIPYWKTENLPSWTRKYLVEDNDKFEHVNYLLTFRPYGHLPLIVKEKYIFGKIRLLPFPGSMMPWGIPEYIKLQEKLYNAIQMPMLRLVKRDEGHSGIRVPQSGWVHQPKIQGEKAKILEEFIVSHYVRTNRWDRFHRIEDGLLKSSETDHVIQTLFSTNLDEMDLYNKPMARNCQLLTESLELLLDGPRANREKIGIAALKVLEGGLFRYRFYFPPMQAGPWEVMWHRPFVACMSKETGKPEIEPGIINGYLTGYHYDNPDLSKPVELWPRFHNQELKLSVLHNFNQVHDHYQHQTPLNLTILLGCWELLGEQPLERDFARALVRIPRNESLEKWLDSFPGRSLDPVKSKTIMSFVENILEKPRAANEVPVGLTFNDTANRPYEEAYWNEIFKMAHGEYINKDNADIVQNHPTLHKIHHRERDLHKLGDYLIGKYEKMIKEAGMEGKAEAGELPFKWETDFEYLGFGGWNANQDGSEYERNILMIIPGKNRNEAVVMGDHYDTAYMEDVFNESNGGTGARVSAAGADDNYSASATLLMAAPIFLKMSREGKLERDVWLLHLTGEEFPSDCMGARNFCQNIVQGTLKMRKPDGSFKDLSNVTVAGVLVMDMIAHNKDHDRDIFQISPGHSGASLKMARHAHLAAQSWNHNVPKWNESPDRKGCLPGQRSKVIDEMPPKALHLKVEGEIRTWDDHHSTLYNTDGLIFSDTGIPVILFMENYDINRKGYHDTHDTMENIDLDYGSAVSAIAIETIARIATEKKV